MNKIVTKNSYKNMDINALLDIMSRLRDPQSGCPWDCDQDMSSITPHTIEEAYEVADAIQSGQMDELREELGDLLFQIVFYAQLAAEQGLFTFDEIVAILGRKIIRRHPHVFAGASYRGDAALREEWEAQKSAERRKKTGSNGTLDGVARALPALMRAEKLQKRAARVGFDWSTVTEVIDKCREELTELEQSVHSGDVPGAVAEEAGDLLFSCVNLVRHLGLDAEHTMRAANDKFERRFRAMELRLAQRDTVLGECDNDTMENVWQEIKREEQPSVDVETSDQGRP